MTQTWHWVVLALVALSVIYAIRKYHLLDIATGAVASSPTVD